MRKLLAILLLTAMMLSMLPALAVADEPITIRISCTAPIAWDPDKDPIAKMILGQFGIIFEGVDYEGDYTKMMLDGMSHNMADIMYTEPLYDLYNFSNLIQQGFYRTVPDELLVKYPLLKAQIDASKVAEAVREHFGGNFILPKPDSLDPTIYVGERKGIFIRKDWLANLGLEIPTTWEEFYEVAKAFTLNDPDGNGVNDTFGFTGDGVGNLRYFFSALGHTNMNWAEQEDGTWIHGALMDDNIEVLEWVRKMYAEGYMDPEQGSTAWQQATQKFASGAYGMLLRNADADWLNTVIVKNFWEANKDKGNPYDYVTLIPALSLDKADVPSMDAYIDCMCATQISADMTDEALDRYLAFHEWCLSEEVQIMAFLGLEGIDWEHNAEGKIVKILDANGNPPALAERYPILSALQMPTWGFALSADPDIQTFDFFNDECKELNAWACSIRNANPVYADMRVKLISLPELLDANSFKFTAEYWTIITDTARPVAESFAAMKALAMNLGFDIAIPEVNALITEKGW